LLAVLRADGHQVIASASGNDLLKTLAVSLHPEFGSEGFDLVISDGRLLGAIELPTFRRLQRWARIPPLVFITAFENDELDVKARQFGAVAVVDVPRDIDKLREMVNGLLRHPTEEHGGIPANIPS
jgi:DNA-binding response OmpR family regulator